MQIVGFSMGRLIYFMLVCFTHSRAKKKTNESTVQNAHTVNLEIPGIGLTLQNNTTQNQSGVQHGRQPPVLRGKPAGARRNQAERETERLLQGIRSGFSLNGMAVGHGE